MTKERQARKDGESDEQQRHSASRHEKDPPRDEAAADADAPVHKLNVEA